MKMMKKSKIFWAFLAQISVLLVPATAANNVANYAGNTGVFETPNARIMPDWSMRMFINQDQPYTYYGFTGTPLPILEANFHMTRIDGIAVNSGSYGDYKDKSISFKLLLQEEREFLPNVVFGGEDVWGTGLYTSKYVAFGKQIGYFDFTLGYAKGRLGGQQVSSNSSANSGSSDNTAFNFMKDLSWGGGKPFGSAVFNATPDLSLMAEYSAIDYSKDRKNPFLAGSKYDLPVSKINYGAKYSLSDNSTLSLSLQRGNQVAFGYSYQFGFSRNAMFPRLPDPKWKADSKKKVEYLFLDEKQLSEKLANEIAAEKMSNVQTSVHENKIWAEFDNPRYNSDIKAAGRAISTIDEVMPENYDTIYATLKVQSLPIKTFKVNRKEYDAFENAKVSESYMKEALIITNSVEKMHKEFSENKKDIYKSSIYNEKDFSYRFSPVIQNYLNAKDKPFATKISAKLSVKLNPTKGLFAEATMQHPIVNTIKDIQSNPLEDAKLSIRSQMLDYYKYDDTQLKRLSAGYMFRSPYDSLAKAEIGYFDFAFAGVDLEWYKSFFDDRFGVGLQYQDVYKRPVDDMLKIYDDLNYQAKFLNIYTLLSQRYDLHLGLKIGQFLAGDKGVKIEIARHHKEFSVGAFATFTNSEEVFSSSQNKGYIDKGVYLRVPLEVFTFKNIKTILNYGLSPWTRDVGTYATGSHSLHPMNNSENNIQIMKKNIQRFKE